MLEVQKYLKEKNLEQLRKELDIKINKYQNLICLNYNQIDSPKIHPIVRECRGLILEEGTWNVVSMAFKRFFNYGEIREENFDFSKAFALEKLDGSLISLYNYKNKWMMSTRGTIEGTGRVNNSNITFRQLFDKTVLQYPNFYNKLNKKYIYIFEIVSPLNKVVKPYENNGLYLINMRSVINDFKELHYHKIYKHANILGVKSPKVYPFKTINDLLKIIKTFRMVDEGFVCINYEQYEDERNFERVKVKNPDHVRLAHMKESLTERNMLAISIQNEEAEVLVHFPEYKNVLDGMKKQYKKYCNKINKQVKEIQPLLKEERGVFAEKAKSTLNPQFMFMLYDNKVQNIADYFLQNIESKNFLNRMVECFKRLS